MKEESTDNSNKTFELSSLDIVLMNCVEENKKTALFNGLKELDGDQEPIDSGVQSALGKSSRVSPDLRLGKIVKFYHDGMNLIEPLPDEFSSLEVSIVNHIPTWCEVICKCRLKEEYLELAKQQFKQHLEETHSLSTPKIIEEAHRKIEDYLSPFIGEKVLPSWGTLKRKYYPYIYLGIVKTPKPDTLNTVIDKTNYTRSAIGWGIGIGSIIRPGYLVQRVGGTITHDGFTHDRMGFAILRVFQIEKGAEPDWPEDTRQSFARLSYDYNMIDTISLLLLTNVVLNHGIEYIEELERDERSLSHRMKEQSNIPNDISSDSDMQGTTDIYVDMARLRSTFLAKRVDLRNELDILDEVYSSTSAYLLSKDANNHPVEEVFVHPPSFADRFFNQEDRPITGVLCSFLQDSRSKQQELLNRINKVEDEQIALMSYINGFLDINLQKSFGKLTKTTAKYTKWLIGLTITLIILTVAIVGIMVLQILQKLPNSG